MALPGTTNPPNVSYFVVKEREREKSAGVGSLRHSTVDWRREPNDPATALVCYPSAESKIVVGVC